MNFYRQMPKYQKAGTALNEATKQHISKWIEVFQGKFTPWPTVTTEQLNNVLSNKSEHQTVTEMFMEIDYHSRLNNYWTNRVKRCSNGDYLILVSGKEVLETLMNTRWITRGSYYLTFVGPGEIPIELAQAGFIDWLSSDDPDFTMLLSICLLGIHYRNINILVGWDKAYLIEDGLRSIGMSMPTFNPADIHLGLMLGHYGLISDNYTGDELLDFFGNRYDEMKFNPDDEKIPELIKFLGLTRQQINYIDEYNMFGNNIPKHDIDYETAKNYRVYKKLEIPELQLYQAIVSSAGNHLLCYHVRQLLIAVPHKPECYIKTRVKNSCPLLQKELDGVPTLIVQFDPELQRRVAGLPDIFHVPDLLALDQTQLIYYYNTMWKSTDSQFCQLHRLDEGKFKLWRSRVLDKHQPSSYAVRKWLAGVKTSIPPIRPVMRQHP